MSDGDFEIKLKIHSLNCLSCFYLYLELQDDFFSEFVSFYVFLNCLLAMIFPPKYFGVLFCLMPNCYSSKAE